MSNVNKTDAQLVAKELVESLRQRITGEDEEWLFSKKPSESVMIGMIGCSSEESSVLKGEIVDNQRFESIPSIGLRARFVGHPTLSIGLKGRFFYRVRPTYDEQISYLVSKYSKLLQDETIVDAHSLLSYLTEHRKDPNYQEPKDKLVYHYKSIQLSSLGLFELNTDSLEQSKETVNEQITKALQEKIDSIRSDSIFSKESLHPISDYLDRENFARILSSSCQECLPLWGIRLFIDLTPYEKYNEIVIQLINNTIAGKTKTGYESQIFDGGLRITCPEGFLPIEINSLKHYYLDKPTLPAIGNNCTVEPLADGTLETNNFPIYVEHRVKTLDSFNDQVTFTALIEDPIVHLRVIAKAMNERLELYRYRLSKRYIKEFEEEIDSFQHEVVRFENGIALLEKKTDVLRAFKLMNKTFAMNKKYSGWRLFQIVFIVSELPDLVYCEFGGTPGFGPTDIENVDLIYFPTGGGKTETFLGCCVFSAFFDRIRGKEDGVTAIIKYPLRLLAAQQLDRVLALTINANVIKAQENLPGDAFSVGFFTGSKNTPNIIDANKKNEIDVSTQESKNANYRQIDVCPKCGHPMDVYFDENEWKLKHRCSNASCGFEPPIYIVDDEIYRYTPTFIISTIDKMANIGTSQGFKSLLGMNNGKCPEHGFVAAGLRCSVPNCKCTVQSAPDRKDPIPTLFIQDELHLVNESLGTFDSHYESLIQYISANLVPPDCRKAIKYIGATATISNYQSHINGLYNKNAKKFPATIQKENFYSYVDDKDISRIIIGAALYGGSITDSIQKIITEMRVLITDWNRNLQTTCDRLQKKGFSGGPNELAETLQQYLIAIAYNNSKDDAGKLESVLENQGNNHLNSLGIPNFNIAEITGDVEFKTVKGVMHEVELPGDNYEKKNIIIATSAISHGVDEDCFNQIYFFGMPNQTAEYIQAYSRVGRKYTGIVFDIFRIVRDKDKSYLKNFANYHQYKDRLIDPVPINRYAKNAIYSTLPGVVAALLYQCYAKSKWAIKVTNEISAGRLTESQLIHDVESIYECDKSESTMYKLIINEEVKRIFSAFETNTSSDAEIKDVIKKASSKHKGPMTNLRDVDVALDVQLRQK